MKVGRKQMQQINLKDTYVVKNVMSGVGKRSGKKWQVITVDGIEPINIFVDNDILLNIGDIINVQKINCVNYSVAKKGDKYYKNYSANCEVVKTFYDVSNDEDVFTDDDMDKVLK